MNAFRNNLIVSLVSLAALCGPAPASTIIGFDGIVDMGVAGPAMAAGIGLLALTRRRRSL